MAAVFVFEVDFNTENTEEEHRGRRESEEKKREAVVSDRKNPPFAQTPRKG